MTTSVEQLKIGDVLVIKEKEKSRWYPDVITVKKIYLRQRPYLKTRVHYICFYSKGGDVSMLRRDIVQMYKLHTRIPYVEGDYYA